MKEKPPIDWSLLRKVAKAHLPMIAGMALMSLVFLCIGLYATLHISISEPLTGYIFGLLFLAAAAGLMFLNFRLNGSSVSFYYSQGMLKKHGVAVDAIVEQKQVKDAKDKNLFDSDISSVPATDREYVVSFRYSLGGCDYKGEACIDDAALFDSIEVARTIPVLVLPYKPGIAYPRMKKLRSMTRQQSSEASVTNENVKVARSLIDHDL